MIVPMKKIYLIIETKEKLKALDNLREVGLVHVEQQVSFKAEETSKIKEDIHLLEKAISVLENNKEALSQAAGDSWKRISEDIISKLETISQLEISLLKRQNNVEEWEPWGDFNPEDIKALAKKNIYAALYKIPKNKINEISPNIIVKVISEEKGVARCIVISQEKLSLPFEAVDIPALSLAQEKSLIVEEKNKIKALQSEIKEAKQYYKFLKAALLEKEERLRFEEVSLGLRKEEELLVLKGFAPAKKVVNLEEVAKNNKWGVLVENITDEDQVPTLVENPKWIELVKPVFGMMNILPGYREFDISLFFLLFFSLFVGMLIGDAGYGMIYLGLSIFAHKKIGNKMPDKRVFPLLYLFCACIILWGVLTGVYFGQEWVFGKIKPLSPWLADTKNIQLFCFLIGAIHLSIAHLWKVIVKFPSPVFLSDIGWTLIVWGMFFAARFFVLNDAMPFFVKYLFYLGIVLVFLFTKPNWNPLKILSPDLLPLSLSIVSAFSDVVSYVRLYAVGLAGVAIADAANQNLIFGLLVLHPLNLVLSVMSVLVHGLRLNVLEFSGHLGLEWAGFKYEPFAKKEKEIIV